jgi:hypothetical protein
MIFFNKTRMGNASDTIRANKAKTFYNFTSNANVITQRNANCGTCAETTPASGTACVLNFPSFDEKLLYLVGKNALLVNSTCTNSQST